MEDYEIFSSCNHEKWDKKQVSVHHDDSMNILKSKSF